MPAKYKSAPKAIASGRTNKRICMASVHQLTSEALISDVTTM